jgi:NTE family protein
VEILVVRPSVNLGKLAVAYEPRLPDTFRLLARSLGSQEATTSDFLSMLMFQPDYLERLMEIGEADAEAQMGEIRALMEGATPSPDPTARQAQPEAVR